MRAIMTMPMTLTLMCAVTAAADAQAPESSQSALISDLKSTSETRRHEAVLYIRDNVQPPMRGEDLNRALVDELLRLNRIAADRVEEDRAGRLKGDFPADYHADLIQLVSQWSDPVAIPALTGALGTGRMVEEAIVKFGDQAVPSLLSVASRKVGLVTTGMPGDTPPHVVAGALDTLSRLLATKAPVGAASRQSIAAMAGQRLTGKQEPSVIRAACKLAVATKDSALRGRVERLANDTREVKAMGVADDALANTVRTYAREALQQR